MQHIFYILQVHNEGKNDKKTTYLLRLGLESFLVMFPAGALFIENGSFKVLRHSFIPFSTTGSGSTSDWQLQFIYMRCRA